MNQSMASGGKIAYILKMFPRFSETFILGEILELERNGTELQIFSLKHPRDKYRHGDVAKVKAPVTYVELTSWRDTPQIIRTHWEVCRWDPKRYLSVAFKALRRRRWGAIKRFIQAGLIAPQIKKTGVTHVHAHFASSATSVSYYLNLLIGISYSFTAHAKDIFINTVAPDVLLRKMNNAAFVVTISDYNHVYLSAVSPQTRLFRIYNGLDLGQFSPNGSEPYTPPLILAVGRLVEKKGFDDLIWAAALLKEEGLKFECKIIGTGEEENRLRNLIAELGVEDVVSLPGPMPREELIRLYPNASVFVAPCVIGEDGNRDGLPTVLIEAMAMRVPVISTPVTGIPEIVHDQKTGLLVSPGSPEELAVAMKAMLTNRKAANHMAEAGRELIEQRFDLQQNVRELQQLLQKASTKS